MKAKLPRYVRASCHLAKGEFSVSLVVLRFERSIGEGFLHLTNTIALHCIFLVALYTLGFNLKLLDHYN